MNESRTVFSAAWQRGKTTRLGRSRVGAEPLQNQGGDPRKAASRGQESKAESKAQQASPWRDNHSGEAEEDPSEGRGRLV